MSLVATIRGITADGTLSTSGLSLEDENSYIAIAYFTDGSCTTIATVTAGTSLVEVSEDGLNFSTIPSGLIDATDTDYARPNWRGPGAVVRVTSSGIVGSTDFILSIFRYRAAL